MLCKFIDIYVCVCVCVSVCVCNCNGLFKHLNIYKNISQQCIDNIQIFSKTVAMDEYKYKYIYNNKQTRTRNDNE